METSPLPVSRIAPTPSGLLHVGNASNFLLTWLWMRTLNGKVILRIDDMDQQRVRAAYVEDIFASLEWLGIDYDAGPTGPDDLAATWSQGHRMPLYESALQQLRQTDLVFACQCSRKQIREQSMEGAYPGTCRGKEIPLSQANVAWRLRTPPNKTVSWQDHWLGDISKSIAPSLVDAVIRRKDGWPAYQVCSVMDDLELGITHVVRGQDLLDSTVFQQHLAEQLRPNAFSQIQWVHHPLLTDPAGQKLSKSAGSSSLANMREQGAKPTAVYQFVSQWLGAAQSARSLPELQDQFGNWWNQSSSRIKNNHQSETTA